MKILVVDSNEPITRFIRTQLESAEHEVIVEHNKSRAAEIAAENVIHAVFLDPAPQKDPQKIIVNLQAALANKAFVTIISENLSFEAVIQSGANDMLRKPLETDPLLEVTENAARFSAFQEKLYTPNEALSGDGGEIIGRAAFAQVFRSALERAKRYKSKPYMLLVKINNHEQIAQDFGEDAATASVERLCRILLKQYRLSEIIAHTDPNEYAIFLENVETKDKALAAAERFAKSFFNDKDSLNDGEIMTELNVELVELPTTRIQASYQL